MKIDCTNKRPDGSPCGYTWKPGVSHRCKYSATKTSGQKLPRQKAHRCASCRRLYLGDDHTCEGG